MPTSIRKKSLCPHQTPKIVASTFRKSLRPHQTCWQREFRFSAAVQPPRSRAFAPPVVPKIHPLPCCVCFPSFVLELDSLGCARGSGWAAARPGPGCRCRHLPSDGRGWRPAALSQHDLALHHSGWLAILKLTCWVGGSNRSTLEPERARGHQFGALVSLK